MVGEHALRLINGNIEDLFDVPAFVPDLERCVVVAMPLAHFAGHIHVRQKVHLHFDNPCTAAGFTSSPLHIETESSRAIPPGPGLRRLRKHLPHFVKCLGVGNRV